MVDRFRKKMKKDQPIPRWQFNRWCAPVFLAASAVSTITLIVYILRPGIWTTVLLLLALFVWGMIMYFFRDPERQTLNEPGLVVAAGDGVVTEIMIENELHYLNTEAVRISVFLSLFDVHIQRAPISGTVKQIEYHPGNFLPAYKPQASIDNEYIAMLVESPYGELLVKQIAGILARRCVNFCQQGDVLTSGQRYGLIKFGSRLDIFLPIGAQILISVGEKVRGGLTPIARLSEGE